MAISQGRGRRIKYGLLWSKRYNLTKGEANTPPFKLYPIREASKWKSGGLLIDQYAPGDVADQRSKYRHKRNWGYVGMRGADQRKNQTLNQTQPAARGI